MRRILLRILLVLAFLTTAFGAWIFAGEKLSLLLDRLMTVQVASLPLRPLTAYEGEEGTYRGGSFQMGGKAMSNEKWDYLAYPLHLRADSQNQLVLTANGKSFILGPVLSTPADDVGHFAFEFAPESGDEASFSMRRGLLSWPTPFEFNFMTGQSASSWRHLYYRLTWKKPFRSKTGNDLALPARLQSNRWVERCLDPRRLRWLSLVEIRP